MSETKVFRRGAIEAVFILGGILGAFWIDAWWDGRSAAILEDELLTRLAVEADRNRAELDRTLELIERWGAKSHSFLVSIPDELLNVEPDSVAPFVASLMRAPTFDPYSAAGVLLLQTPTTGQRTATRIRALVSEWSTELADAEEDRDRLLAASRVTERIVASYLVDPPYLVDAPRTDFLQQIRSDPELLAALRADADFVGALLVRLDSQSLYRRELNQAGRVLDSIRDALAELNGSR